MRTVTLALLSTLTMAASSAMAGMAGNDVRLDWLYPNTGNSLDNTTLTVPFSGVPYTCCISNEMTPVASVVNVSVSDTSVAMDGSAQTFTAATFNGLSVFDVNGTIDPIVGVSLVFSSLPNFDASDISFTADQLLLNLAGTDAANQGAWRFEVALDFGNGPGPVPEPATLALLGLGLAGLAATRRRTR